MGIDDVVQTDKFSGDLHLLHGLANMMFAHERLPGISLARFHELFSSSFDLLEALVVFLRFLHQLQSMKFVHALDARAIFQPSYFIEFVLQFLPGHFFEPLLPHNPVVLLLLLPVVDDLLPSFRADGSGILDAFLHLLLRFFASLDVLDDLDLFFFDGFLLSYLHFHLLGIKHFPLTSLFGIIGF